MKKSEFLTIKELIEITSENLKGFNNKEEFAQTLNHIENIIDSSILLFKHGFYNQSLFFSITAFEEIIKAEICIYRGFGNKPIVKRSKDGLYIHEIKHLLAADEIFFNYIKERKLFGLEKIKEIQVKFKNGYYLKLREESIYFQSSSKGLKLPQEVISKLESKIILIICMEFCEDKLSGYSNKGDLTTDRVSKKLRDFETF